MTYSGIVKRLWNAGIADAETDAALLLEAFAGVSRAGILADPARDYTDPRLEEAVARRETRYPLQYILGEWTFYKETYLVNESCLIPRSDTELLVEEAIRRLPPGAHFADLCTGSGCIAISTLASRPDCSAVGVDLYEDTLALARENARKNKVSERLNFLCDDVLAPEHSLAPYAAILSNPPYIRSDVIKTLDTELTFEPNTALDGGKDGLTFYRLILAGYKKCLGETGFFLFEIGYDQSEDILALAASHGFDDEIKRDLGGNPRLAILYPSKKGTNL